MYKVLSFLFLITLLSSGSSAIAAEANPKCKTLWGDITTKLTNVQKCITDHHVKDCDPTTSVDSFCECKRNNMNVIREDCKVEITDLNSAFKDAHGCIHPHHTYPTCHSSKKKPTHSSKKNSK